MTSAPTNLGAAHPLPVRPGASNRECSAETDPRIEGFMNAIAFVMGIDRSELEISIKGGGEGDSRSKLCTAASGVPQRSREESSTGGKGNGADCF